MVGVPVTKLKIRGRKSQEGRHGTKNKPCEAALSMRTALFAFGGLVKFPDRIERGASFHPVFFDARCM